MGHAHRRPAPERLVRLAGLHPPTRGPGRGDQLQPATRRPNDEAKAFVDPTILLTRRSSRPRIVIAKLERRRPTPRATPSASTSGKSSSRRSAADAASAARSRRCRRPHRRSRKDRTRPAGARLRSGLLTTVLLLPAGLWYLVLLVLPLAIVVVFSFGTRAKNGGYSAGLRLRQLRPRDREVRPVRHEPADGHRRHRRVPARRAAARLLPGDARRQAQERLHPACSSSRSGRASSSAPTRG